MKLVAHVDAYGQQFLKHSTPVAAQRVAAVATQHTQPAAQRAHGGVERLPLLLRGRVVIDVVEHNRVVRQKTVGGQGKLLGAYAADPHTRRAKQRLDRFALRNQQYAGRARYTHIGACAVVPALLVVRAAQPRFIGHYARFFRGIGECKAVFTFGKRHGTGGGWLAVLV